MPDKITEEQRSHIMSRIRSKNTKIEMLIRKELWKRGFRYRLHYPLPGKPDIVFPSRYVAIFCDGCFWHGCPKCFRPPQSNKNYWRPKIANNRKRAKRQTTELEDAGWIVLRFWEHEIIESCEGVVDQIEKKLSE